MTMAPIKVFWLEQTEAVRVSLRRFTFSGDKKCRASDWGHDADTVIEPETTRGLWPDSSGDHDKLVTHDDPRWPADCEQCGEPFQQDDEWQVNVRKLWRGAPDGRLYALHDAPKGAMWDAHWMGEHDRGPDGICLVVKTPGGDWMVDGRCSNCTRPKEPHQCWTRAGDPRTGTVDVGKQYGETCSAGAGSIIAGGWHGFLRAGWLVE